MKIKNIALKLASYIRGNWGRIARDIGILVVVVWAVQAWQGSGLLPTSGQTKAPEFNLPALDRHNYSLASVAGKRVLIYFFAPWCSVCNVSIDNIEEVKQDVDLDKVAFFAVALDYGDIESVEKFVATHELSMPVILGDEEMQKNYQVAAYPTYYIIDENGFIKGASVGYTTSVGLRWRL